MSRKQKVDYELWAVQIMSGSYGWYTLIHTLNSYRLRSISKWKKHYQLSRFYGERQLTSKDADLAWRKRVANKELRCVKVKIVAKDQV